MPRTARAAVGGLCYHVLNRGNARAEVFHKPEDNDAFVGLFAEASPVKLPSGWAALVNRPQRESEVQSIRNSIQRGAPLGSERWTTTTAERLGLESTLRPRGRPPKPPEK